MVRYLEFIKAICKQSNMCIIYSEYNISFAVLEEKLYCQKCISPRSTVGLGDIAVSF